MFIIDALMFRCVWMCGCVELVNDKRTNTLRHQYKECLREGSWASSSSSFSELKIDFIFTVSQTIGVRQSARQVYHSLPPPHTYHTTTHTSNWPCLHLALISVSGAW